MSGITWMFEKAILYENDDLITDILQKCIQIVNMLPNIVFLEELTGYSEQPDERKLACELACRFIEHNGFQEKVITYYNHVEEYEQNLYERGVEDNIKFVCENYLDEILFTDLINAERAYRESKNKEKEEFPKSFILLLETAGRELSLEIITTALRSMPLLDEVMLKLESTNTFEGEMELVAECLDSAMGMRKEINENELTESLDENQQDFIDEMHNNRQMTEEEFMHMYMDERMLMGYEQQQHERQREYYINGREEDIDQYGQQQMYNQRFKMYNEDERGYKINMNEQNDDERRFYIQNEQEFFDENEQNEHIKRQLFIQNEERHQNEQKEEESESSNGSEKLSSKESEDSSEDSRENREK